MTKVLKSDSIYLGDNGRAFCGDCAGMTAQYTGRDLSGQKVHEVTPEDVAVHADECLRMVGRVVPLACESCGKEPMRIHGPSYGYISIQDARGKVLLARGAR